jgi:hypothetical protein
MEDWRYTSTILDLVTRCTVVFSFKPRLLYPKGNSLPPRYQFYRRLGWPQSRYGRCGVKHIYIYIFSLPGIEPRSSSS